MLFRGTLHEPAKAQKVPKNKELIALIPVEEVTSIRRFSMKKTVAIAAFITALTIFPALAANDHEHNHSAMQSSPAAEQQPFDIQFLDTMIQHHKEGIDMIQMGAEKAENPEVRSMAQKMVEEQKKEIPELQNLRNEVKANAPEAVNRNLPGMEPMDHSKLESATGAEFDREFLNMTIKHHQGAVEMADMALNQAQNPDVKAKAQMMHDKQKQEIEQMQGMLN